MKLNARLKNPYNLLLITQTRTNWTINHYFINQEMKPKLDYSMTNYAFVSSLSIGLLSILPIVDDNSPANQYTPFRPYQLTIAC